MTRVYVWQIVCVALVAFVCGNWFATDRHGSVGTAYAVGAAPDPRAEQLKANSIQFVDARGNAQGTLLVRDAVIDGRRTLQLALVDEEGKDAWTGPAAVKIVPAR